MAIVLKADQWEDLPWDDPYGGGGLIQVGDTFNVSTIDLNNRAVVLTPLSSSYTGNILVRSWDDSPWDDEWTNLGLLIVGQTFTVTAVNINNRAVYFSG